MTLQPGFGRDDFLGRVALPENFLQQVGALKKQQPLGLSPRTVGQGSQPFDQGIASAADQGRGGIQRTTSERCVFAHLQAFVNAQIFAIQLKAVDGCDLPLDSLRCKVFDHLFDHLILNGGVIDGIRSEQLKELANLGSNNFRSVGDLENDHGCRELLPDKVSADGET